MAENTGTHVDAPSHFVPGKRSIDRIPLEHLVVPVSNSHFDGDLTGAWLGRWG
jgi:kynurenine formamidase